MEITIVNGKIHYKWPFSIAMLIYQRVSLEYHWNSMEQHWNIHQKIRLFFFVTIFSQESEFWGIYRHVILPKGKLLAGTPRENLGQIACVYVCVFSMPLSYCTMVPWAPTWAPTSLLQEVVSLEHDVSNTGASQPTGFIDLLLRSLLQVLRVHRVQRKQWLPLRSPSDLECLSWIHWDRCGSMGRARAPHGTTWHHQLIPSYQQQILQIDGSRWFQSGCNLHRSRGFIENQAAQALGWRRATHLHCKGGVLWNAVHSPTNVIFLAILLLLQVLSFGPAVLITLTSGCQAHVVVKKNYLQATRFYECGGTSYKMVPISDSKCIRFFQQIPTGSVSSITSCSNQATVLDKDLSHALCMDARLLAFPTLITEPQGMGCYSIIVLGTTWDRLPHVATWHCASNQTQTERKLD